MTKVRLLSDLRKYEKYDKSVNTFRKYNATMSGLRAFFNRTGDMSGNHSWSCCQSVVELLPTDLVIFHEIEYKYSDEFKGEFPETPEKM